MAKGDPPTSPWTYTSSDDPSVPRMTISVPWDDSVGGTRAILNGTVVHRDAGCVYHTVVFANPAIGKPMPSMTDSQTDATFTAAQVRQATGFRTYDDIIAAGQCTAQP